MWYYNYNIHTPQYNINAFCNLFAAGPDSFISLGVLANCIAVLHGAKGYWTVTKSRGKLRSGNEVK